MVFIKKKAPSNQPRKATNPHPPHTHTQTHPPPPHTHTQTHSYGLFLNSFFEAHASYTRPTLHRLILNTYFYEGHVKSKCVLIVILWWTIGIWDNWFRYLKIISEVVLLFVWRAGHTGVVCTVKLAKMTAWPANFMSMLVSGFLFVYSWLWLIYEFYTCVIMLNKVEKELMLRYVSYLIPV